MATREEMLEILRIGTTAISPYNTQPWRFRLGSDRIDVHILRTKNFFLKLQGVSHMTLGCLLENIEAGARHLGYRAATELYDRPLGPDEPCAEVVLQSNQIEREPDVSHVVDRVTNRKPYLATPLPAEVRAQILSAAGPGVTVFVSEADDKRRLARILGELEAVRLSNYKMIREALEYVRFSEEEMAARPEGLDIRTLELDPRIVPLVRPIQRRRVHRLLKLAGVVGVASRRHREQLEASAAILTYAIEDRDPASFVGLGRIIQRTLNELSRADVASMAVLSGLYLLDVLQSNPEIFSRRETRALIRAKEALERFFELPERNIVFIVRVGRAQRPEVRQCRRPVEELLLGP